jgi:hypothetical protein
VATAWVLFVVVVGELRDPPMDPIRVVVHLVLATLFAWFFVWTVTRLSRNAGGR